MIFSTKLIQVVRLQLFTDPQLYRIMKEFVSCTLTSCDQYENKKYDHQEATNKINLPLQHINLSETVQTSMLHYEQFHQKAWRGAPL